ncbi:hypothetical protein ACWDSJ_20705 [Nocardia sp. NPDC003482]
MRTTKFAAIALLAIGATGITAGAVNAQPAPASGTEIAVHATDHGIGFVTAPTTDHRGVVTTVDSGRFALAPDAASITLTGASGEVVASIPLGLRTAANTVALTPTIADEGRTLTLTTQTAGTEVAQAVDEAQDTIARKQYNAGVGALIGAGIGAVIGFFLGGVGALVTVPIGAGIGALIGYSTP